MSLLLFFNSHFHQRVESNIITLQYIYILIVSSSILIGYGHVYGMLMNMNMYNQQSRWVVGPWRPKCVCPCENEHCYRLKPFSNVVNLQRAIGIWGISHAHLGYACLECLPWDIQVVPVCVSLFQCEIQALQCKFQSSIFCHIQVLAVKNSSDLVQSMPLSWSNNTTINICSF